MDDMSKIRQIKDKVEIISCAHLQPGDKDMRKDDQTQKEYQETLSLPNMEMDHGGRHKQQHGEVKMKGNNGRTQKIKKAKYV